MKFLIHFLPARYGDSIWIEYGREDDLHHILIDGGTSGTAVAIQMAIDNLPGAKKHLELVVVTHLDQDHLAGILTLLSQDSLNFTIGDVWFNGWDHLNPPMDVEKFGAKQAELLSACIMKHRLSWNEFFENGPVVVKNITNLPLVHLPGGMKLTLLSPLEEDLLNLKPVWVAELIKANLVPGYGTDIPEEIQAIKVEAFGSNMPDVEGLSGEPFKEDKGEGNASSIAFLAEYAGKCVLFTGDALPSKILRRLQFLQPEGKMDIDLFKVSHHASVGNTSTELIKKLNCNKYAISTNGACYYHPSPQTIARIIKNGGPGSILYFNYRSEYNEMWDNQLLKQVYVYNTEYGVADEGAIVDLIDY